MSYFLDYGTWPFRDRSFCAFFLPKLANKFYLFLPRSLSILRSRFVSSKGRCQGVLHRTKAKRIARMNMIYIYKKSHIGDATCRETQIQQCATMNPCAGTGGWERHHARVIHLANKQLRHSTAALTISVCFCDLFFYLQAVVWLRKNGIPFHDLLSSTLSSSSLSSNFCL